MPDKTTISNDLLSLPAARWLTAAAAVVFASVVSPLTLASFHRNVAPIDLKALDEEAVMSMEDMPHRYDFLPEGQAPSECPGAQCPLNPEVPATSLRNVRTLNYIVQNLMTSEGWRGTMYLRWDTVIPAFVADAGQPVAFDFYGIAGKSWRLFVNGTEVASGRGGPRHDAVTFAAPGAGGSPLTIGFEIDVGRSLAPGLISVAQPFLSRPSIAPHLRLAYRGLDKDGLTPLSIGYTIIALLAALSCFLTPFYKEILAFSFYVSLMNWRVMLINDMAMFPEFFNVDWVTVNAMIASSILASLWAFWGLYFRIQNRLIWVPVVLYAVLTPLFWASGRYGFALSAVISMVDGFAIHQVAAFLGGLTLAINVWRVTRGKPWAKYRTVVSVGIALLCLVVAVGLGAQSYVLPGNQSIASLAQSAPVHQFAQNSLRLFIFAVGFAIALEWALIVRDRQKVLQRFGTVVDPRLVEDIIRGPERQSRVIDHVVVLFVDLRSFTKICDVFPPDRVMVALNDYLDVVTKAVQANGGVVDKFVGDAVMALWGVPEMNDEDSLRAARAAIDIRVGMATLNAMRAARGEFPLDIGIGIHGGPAIFGAIGNGSRVDHTVIGPTINVASRLQGVTKDFKCDIVISYSVLETIRHNVMFEDLGPIPIRGMTSHVSAARMIGVISGDGTFMIGDAALEAAVSDPAPGRVSNLPPNVVARDYESIHKAERAIRQTAA